MRVLLDCRPLQKLGAGHEMTRGFIAAAQQMIEHEGVEWVYLINKRGAAVAWGSGEVAAVFFNHRWTVPRVKRRFRCEKVVETTGLVLPPAVGAEVAPLSFEAREGLKGRFAGGKEYFYADVNGKKEEDVVELLKAFSKFKKRQKSNMQLVLAGAAMGEKMATYKYREDVHAGVAAAMGGAYAVIIEKEEPGLDMLEAWTMDVPVIRMAYADAGMADQLMLVYKDERIRGQMIKDGKVRSRDYSWKRTREAINGYLAGC